MGSASDGLVMCRPRDRARTSRVVVARPRSARQAQYRGRAQRRGIKSISFAGAAKPDICGPETPARQGPPADRTSTRLPARSGASPMPATLPLRPCGRRSRVSRFRAAIAEPDATGCGLHPPWAFAGSPRNPRHHLCHRVSETRFAVAQNPQRNDAGAAAARKSGECRIKRRGQPLLCTHRPDNRELRLSNGHRGQRPIKHRRAAAGAVIEIQEVENDR